MGSSNNIDFSQYLDIQDVMRITKHSRGAVHKWLSQGKLLKIKIGKRVLIDPKDLHSFLTSHKQQS